MTRRVLVTLALAAALAPGATLAGRAAEAAPPSGEAATLTVHAAVQRALAAFPAVAASRAQQDEARAVWGQAASAYYPSLRVTGSATRYQEPMVASPIHGFRPDALPEFGRTLVQGALGASFTLFDGGARGARLHGARAQVEAARAALDATQQQLAGRTVATYLEALGQRQVLDAQMRRIEALEGERARVRQLFDVGRAAAVETLRVVGTLAAAAAEQVRAAAALEVALHDLAELTGMPHDSVAAARLLPVTLADSALAAREELVAAALAAAPALQRARQQQAAAQAAARVASGARWPELRLLGSWVDYRNGEREMTDEWSGGVQLSFPLFTGFAVEQEAARARAASRGAGEQLRLAEVQVRQEVDRALSAAREAQARVASLEVAVARYAELARIERLSLAAGSGTQTDYLNAEADLLTARASLIEARHAQIAARVELARVGGQLDTAWLARALETQP
jgi:outer membrane protein TolC